MNDDITKISDGVCPVGFRRPGSDFVAEISGTLIRRFRHQRQYRAEESVVPIQFAHCFFSFDALSMEPVPGDELVDPEGNCWIVVEVHRSELNRTWQCVAKAYFVRFELDEFVDHLKTAYEKSSAGVLQRGFRVAKTGMSCRFSSVIQTLGQAGIETLFVLTRDPVEIDPHDVLRRADGTLFDIVQVKRPMHENGWTEIKIQRSLFNPITE